jgi:hypothetical protein
MVDEAKRKKVEQQLQAMRKVLQESKKKIDAALARVGKADQAMDEVESEQKPAK